MRNGGRRRLALLLVGAVVIGLTTVFLQHTAVPVILWLAIGLDALRHARAVFVERRRDAAFTQDDDTPEGVFVYEHLWAEGLRAFAQTLFILVGVGAVVLLFWKPLWFQTVYGEFFTASFLYVQFLLWMNSRQGRTLPQRMKEARTAQVMAKESNERRKPA